MSITMHTLTQSHFDHSDDKVDLGKIDRLVPLGLARSMANYYESTPVKKRVLLIVLALHILVLLFLLTPAKPAMPVIEEVPLTVSLLQEIPAAPIIKPTETPTPKPPEPKKLTRVKPENVIPLPVSDTPSPIQTNDAPSPTIEKPTVPMLETPSTVSTKTPSASTKLEETKVSEPATTKADEVEPPKFGVAYLNNPKPEYPRIARRAGEQGNVLLHVLVNDEGLPEKVEISRSSGFERLDASALEAVKKWRFVPAKRNNTVISAYVMVPIQFSLD